MKRIPGEQLARQIALGTLDRRQIIEQACDTIAQLDPMIQAFTATLGREQALAAAAQASGPLAGLPVAVKDIFDTATLPTAYGSPIYRDHQPAADAAIVSLIRRAGGIVLGKTVTCEFAYMAPTPTRNPADLQRTAGGSSSGSAAAVAAGMVPFAIGTQTGGSTIRPAAYCGIAGYKPTFDLFPTAGMKCFSRSLDTVGLFAVSVADVAWLAATLIGRPLQPAGATLEHLVVGVPQAYPWEAPSAVASAAVQAAAEAVEAQGGSVRPVILPPWMRELYQAHAVLQQYEASHALAFEFDLHGDQLSPKLGQFLQEARHVSASQYDAVRQRIASARQGLGKLFDGIDVLLTPSAPDVAPLGWSSTGEPTFNKVWTLLGTPCVNVPGLAAPDGAPMGVQIVAPPWQDQRCLNAALLVESALRDQARHPSGLPV